MVSILSAENDALRKENENLSRQVDWFMEQMRLMKKKAFGASSEKSGKELLEQLSLLFNEPELQLSAQSTEAAPVAGYT
jgi:predicted phage gp36 major capsid-like protein